MDGKPLNEEHSSQHDGYNDQNNSEQPVTLSKQFMGILENKPLPRLDTTSESEISEENNEEEDDDKLYLSKDELKKLKKKKSRKKKMHYKKLTIIRKLFTPDPETITQYNYYQNFTVICQFCNRNIRIVNCFIANEAYVCLDCAIINYDNKLLLKDWTKKPIGGMKCGRAYHYKEQWTFVRLTQRVGYKYVSLCQYCSLIKKFEKAKSDIRKNG